MKIKSFIFFAAIGCILTNNGVSQTICPYLSNYSSTTYRNYIRGYTPEEPRANTSDISLAVTSVNKLVNTDYYDGLGRPMEEVQKNAIPGTGKPDIVIVYVYDSIGRETYQYPQYSYADGAANMGKLKTTPRTQLITQYNSLYLAQTPFFYNETVYDNSPLNRVVKNMGAGMNWVGAGKGVQDIYSTNVSGDVISWTVGTSNNLINSGYYSTGQLYITSVTDEDGHISYEYKDKYGRVILKRQVISTSPASYASTYYVYNDLGLLKFVITPDAINDGIISASGAALTNILNGLCYSYLYDERNRVVEKKLPGKDVEYLVYDTKDRLILEQDGLLRNGNAGASDDIPSIGNAWRFTYYDVLDRPVMTGLYTPALPMVSRGAIQSTVISGGFTSTTDLLTYLTNNEFNNYPTTNFSNGWTFIVNYYDDYSNTDIAGTTFDASYNSQLTGTTPTAVTPMQSTQNKGLLTGRNRKLIDNNALSVPTLSYGQWKRETNFYDSKERLVQTRSDILSDGIYNVTTNQYDFSGALISSVMYDHNPQAGTIYPAGPTDFFNTTIIKSYLKDNYSGKATGIKQKINSQPFETVNNLTYDVLGRAANKNQNIADNHYTYNVRGWLEGINANYFNSNSSNIFFCEQLMYDNVGKYDALALASYLGHSSGSIPFGSHPLLNGNIAGSIWQGYMSSPIRSYAYTYDNDNRLTNAYFAELGHVYSSTIGTPGPNHWTNSATDFTMSGVTYDQNGNIQTMNQRGPNPGYAPVDMDKLTYSYTSLSNQLAGIKDDGVVVSVDPDFKDDAGHSMTDYAYDNNGNLTKDGNKGLTISYNYLNQPEHITSSKGNIDYLYYADGTKRQKNVHDITTGSNTVTWYNGSFQYQNGSLQCITHEEGRCRPQISIPAGVVSYVYDYFIKDHLDNVRSVASAQSYTTTATATSGGVTAYKATHEVSMASIEEAIFDHIPPVRADKPGSTNPSDVKTATLLGADSSKRIGTSILLQVMPGDKFSLQAVSYHEGSSDTAAGTNGDLINSLLGVLGGGFGGTLTGGEPAQHMQIFNSVFSNPDFGSTYNHLLAGHFDPHKPKAFLNYIVLDENLNIVPDQSGVIQVAGTPGHWYTIGTSSDILVKQPGYVMAFMSSLSTLQVSIDNFVLTLYSGHEIEEDHYYPFGLNIETPITGAINPNQVNNIKYNGKELQRKEFSDQTGLTWEDYGARMQDPQIGRWNGIDEKAEYYYIFSPYVYGVNNPVKYLDEDGKGVWDIVVGYAFGAATDILPGSGGLRDSYKPDNSADYNNGLRGADIVMSHVGQSTNTTGEGGMIAGGGIAVTAGGAIVVTGGVATPVAAPAVFVGGEIAGVGAAMTAGGAYLMANTASNASQGYNRGSGSSQEFGGGNDTRSRTDREANRRAKDQNGVPRSQQPERTVKPNTPEGNAAGLDDRNVRLDIYTNSKGEKVYIRKDKAATYKDGGSQDKHYNGGKAGDKLDNHHYYGQ